MDVTRSWKHFDRADIDLGIRRQRAQEALHGAARRMGIPVHPCQLADGVDQYQSVQEQRNQVAHAHFLANDLVTSNA